MIFIWKKKNEFVSLRTAGPDSTNRWARAVWQHRKRKPKKEKGGTSKFVLLRSVVPRPGHLRCGNHRRAINLMAAAEWLRLWTRSEWKPKGDTGGHRESILRRATPSPRLHTRYGGRGRRQRRRRRPQCAAQKETTESAVLPFKTRRKRTGFGTERETEEKEEEEEEEEEEKKGKTRTPPSRDHRPILPSAVRTS